jgi:7-cyano-7-deazaguanine reductase
MSVEHSLLGKDTNYPTTYQPDILFPIARATAREHYAHVEGIQQGKDWWHVFEISWLNHHGVPQVAIGRISLPATSPNLIESKSLKLYFNSMNFTQFESKAAFKATVEQDLSAAAGADVSKSVLQHLPQRHLMSIDLHWDDFPIGSESVHLYRCLQVD